MPPTISQTLDTLLLPGRGVLALAGTIIGGAWPTRGSLRNKRLTSKVRISQDKNVNFGVVNSAYNMERVLKRLMYTMSWLQAP
jgi:hypothetical protein